jgi:5-methylcytosine-specific restriction endonuclease McrA
VRDPRPGLVWAGKRLAIRREYGTYMDSPTWFARRKRWIAEWTEATGSTPSCLACGGEWSTRRGALHHRTYDRLGHERANDLIPLCRACHDQLHARMEGSPEWRKRPRPQATDALLAHMRRRKETVDDGRD